MNKKEMALALTPILFGLNHNAHAALASNAMLDFDQGAVASCAAGTDPNTSTGCLYDAVSSLSGSYFAIDFGNNGNYIADNDYMLISAFEGLRIGQTQAASGSSSGGINGSELPSIDNPWVLLGSTGMHQTTSNINILGDDGNGNVSLDFSGWGMDWNSISELSLNDPANDTGIATLTCAVDCAYGDSFMLEYFGTFNPSGTATPYYLYMEGTVSAVPVPAAIWLFGSGLLGLVGWSKNRRRHA